MTWRSAVGFLTNMLRRLGLVAVYVLSTGMILSGALGLTVVYIDPMPVIASLFPLEVEGTVIYVEEASVRSLLAYLNDNLVATVAVSSTLILIGIAAHVRNFSAWARGIRRTPMGIVRSPIRAYRRLAVWRNWVLAKVAALNAESARWKATFNIMKFPYTLLRASGMSPQMSLGLLFAGSTVGTGVVINETILAEKSFKRGDSGVYAAPRDIPVSYSDSSNTLRIDLGSTPVREITIENVSVGTVFTGSALPSGEANVVQISGNTISGGTNTRLEIGHLIFEKSRCKKLTLTDIQAHTLRVIGNASDGHSLSPSPSSSTTHRMRAIGGGHHQADILSTSGGTYDRIWIQAPTSGVNGKIGTLRLTNLYTKGGDCVLSKLTVGTLEILLNEIGSGGGFSTKEFAITTTVTAANIVIEDNVEVTIAEPATQ
jgi:hypothetical protein